MKEFCFTVEASIPPKELIEKKFLPVIKNSSRNYLYAKVIEYTGYIKSYETVTKSYASALATVISSEKEKREYHDIQNELGELNKTHYTYELFIGSEIYKSYKYRIMFVRYGKAGYPATIVLADALAREVQYPATMEKSYIYKIESMAQMDIVLQKILDSDVLYSVMQEAINASIIEEQRINQKKKDDV